MPLSHTVRRNLFPDQTSTKHAIDTEAGGEKYMQTPYQNTKKTKTISLIESPIVYTILTVLNEKGRLFTYIP